MPRLGFALRPLGTMGSWLASASLDIIPCLSPAPQSLSTMGEWLSPDIVGQVAEILLEDGNQGTVASLCPVSRRTHLGIIPVLYLRLTMRGDRSTALFAPLLRHWHPRFRRNLEPAFDRFLLKDNGQPDHRFFTKPNAFF